MKLQMLKAAWKHFDFPVSRNERGEKGTDNTDYNENTPKALFCIYSNVQSLKNVDHTFFPPIIYIKNTINILLWTKTIIVNKDLLLLMFNKRS